MQNSDNGLTRISLAGHSHLFAHNSMSQSYKQVFTSRVITQFG